MVSKTERLILENQIIIMRALAYTDNYGKVYGKEIGILEDKMQETKDILNPTKQEKAHQPFLENDA